jgi:hypothetical protein
VCFHLDEMRGASLGKRECQDCDRGNSDEGGSRGLSIEDNLGRKHTLMAVEFEPFSSGRPGDWTDKHVKIQRR